MSDTTTCPPPVLAARIGIDWGDKKHAWALQPAGSQKIERGEMDHTPEAIQEWAVALRQRFPEGCLAVALESSRGPLVFALSKYEHLVLYPVHPNSAAEYRKVFRPSGAKSDAPDAALLLDLLSRHGDKLRPLNPDTPQTRALQLLTEHRRRLVNERTRFTNRLGADLKSYYPQLLEWFEDPYAPVALDFLKQWPTVEELQKASRATLRKFFKQHQCRNEAKNEQRIEAMSKAVAATTDFAVITAGQLATQSAVGILRELGHAIQEYDQQIEKLAQAHPDFAIFDSFPGAGAALVPRLIAAFGTQRERYQTATDMQQYSGIAPVTEASGNHHWVHWRWSCPKFLRQTFHEWAGQSIQRCDWAAAYYQAQREDKNQSHNSAIRALAYKWIRIAFRCWQDRKPYDDSHYEAILRQRAAQVKKPIQPPPFELPLQWISCGSFQKIAFKQPQEIHKTS